MKKILLAIIVGFGFILNVNAVSKATIKEYTKNYMLEKYNWGDEQYIALVNLVNKESGWNYKAKNKNGYDLVKIIGIVETTTELENNLYGNKITKKAIGYHAKNFIERKNKNCLF